MEERIVNQKELKKNSSKCYSGGESSCIYSGDEIMKIIQNRLLKDDREKIIRELYYFDHKDVVSPLYALTEKNKFIGYGMKYYKDYTVFAEYLNNKKTSFEDRKELMIRLSKIFDYFDQMNFAYYDLHSGNILYKNGDIKLIDLDGGVIKGYINDGMDYNTAIRLAKKNLAKFTLQTINGVTEFYFNSLKKYKNKRDVINFMNNLPENIKNLYSYALNDEYYYFSNMTSVLNDITKDVYEDTQNILKKRPRLY